MSQILIFTDGAAKGNPGPGGYGAVILENDVVTELGEGKCETTNNEMELKAVVEALKQVKEKGSSVSIYTDSKYVVEGAQGWVFSWIRNGWKTKAKTDVLHKGLWQALVDLQKNFDIEWHKVPGHAGLIGNERADNIASDFGDKKHVTLFEGPRESYHYDIENVTYDEEEAKRRSEARVRQSAKAYSYVSMVGGEIQTHETWAECHSRVNGKKARFKKALTEEEEREIIESYKKEAGT